MNASPLDPVIASIASGSFKAKHPPQIRGTGYAADALEAALWAFHSTDDFAGGCLKAVNLGDDADTTAAIYGQIAGAFYGESAIPDGWRKKLAKRDLLDRYAESLFQLAFLGPVVSKERCAQGASQAKQLIAESGNDPIAALTQFLGADDELKGELGVFDYHMGGSMGAAEAHRETLLQLRIAAGTTADLSLT